MAAKRPSEPIDTTIRPLLSRATSVRGRQAAEACVVHKLTTILKIVIEAAVGSSRASAAVDVMPSPSETEPTVMIRSSASIAMAPGKARSKPSKMISATPGVPSGEKRVVDDPVLLEAHDKPCAVFKLWVIRVK